MLPSRHMRRIFMALAFALAACSSGGDNGDTNADAPPCDELFADGADTDAALEQAGDTGCALDDGSLWISSVGSYACTDGRLLQWNDYGWGYARGEWNAHQGAEKTPPDDEITACLD